MVCCSRLYSPAAAETDTLAKFIIAWGKEKYSNPYLRRKFVRQTNVNVAFMENGYDSLDAEKFNFGYRLLGVARFWNIVEYYCPNRDITDVPWDEILKPLILKAADKSIGVEALFAELISQLNDTHAYADGNVTDIKFPYGITTFMTGMGILYPDGSNAQRAGVKVDCVIEPSAQSLIDCRDEVLAMGAKTANPNS